jgi:hypothetical protein
MICPVKLTNEVPGLRGTLRSSMTRCGHVATERSRSGAGDETTGRHVAGDGQTDHLVQAAEILNISCRQMQRWKTRFEHEGYEGLFDRRRGIPSPKRVPLETVETVLRLYQEQPIRFMSATTPTDYLIA